MTCDDLPLLPPLRRDALTPLRAYAQLRVLLAHRSAVRATEATLLGALRGCVRQLDRIDDAIARLEEQAHDIQDRAP